MGTSAFGPIIEDTGINDYLSLSIQFEFGPIHGPWSGPFEIDPFAVIAAPMTGALEFVFARFPVGSTAQVSATRIDNEQTLGIAHYPYPVVFLILRVYAITEIRRITDPENGIGFEENARKKVAQEHEEISPQESQGAGNDNAASTRNRA